MIRPMATHNRRTAVANGNAGGSSVGRVRRNCHLQSIYARADKVPLRTGAALATALRRLPGLSSCERRIRPSSHGTAGEGGGSARKRERDDGEERDAHHVLVAAAVVVGVVVAIVGRGLVSITTPGHRTGRQTVPHAESQQQLSEHTAAARIVAHSADARVAAVTGGTSRSPDPRSRRLCRRPASNAEAKQLRSTDTPGKADRVNDKRTPLKPVEPSNRRSHHQHRTTPHRRATYATPGHRSDLHSACGRPSVSSRLTEQPCPAITAAAAAAAAIPP